MAQIAGDVEGWIASHPEHPLAKSMRVRCTRRWEALWSETMAGFDRSRENREVTVERTSRAAMPGAERQAQVTVVEERTVRKHPGDVRFLQVMAAEPTRSVCFLEVHALMRLVNDSIHRRDDFRLAEIDRLLFGNKIIEERRRLHKRM